MGQRILTIITINYNNVKGLAQTIKSVTGQSFKNFEYIIIDGGSVDGSVELIQQQQDNITVWISERDKGIYHAMNKGIERANGKYILFLNSGDYLAENDILEKVVPELDTADIIYGNLLIAAPGKTWEKQYPAHLNFSYFIHDSLPHSGGIFIRRDSFKGDLSRYDESLKIVSDWKWFLAAIFKHNSTYKHINRVIGVFDFSGTSASNPELLQREKQHVIESEFREIYREVSGLSGYKVKYETLLSSRYLQWCLKFKKLISWK